jgi:tetratricopeptide (TPR) repeat protein
VTASEALPESSPPASLASAIALLAAGAPGAGEGFEQALAAEATPGWRAVALLGKGLCEELAGSPSAARASVRAALEQWAAAEPGACAVALAALGRSLAEGAEQELAARLVGSARRLAAGGPSEVVGGVLVEVGAAAAERGEAGAAAACWQEALEVGDARSAAAAAANLGRLAAARGDAEAALRLFDRALAVADGLHLRVVGDGLAVLAAQAAVEGRWDDVGDLLRQALPLRQADADAPGAAAVLHDLGIAHWRRGQLHAATRDLEDSRRSAEELGDDTLRAAALRALALVSLAGERLVVALAYGREAALTARDDAERRAAAAVLQEVGDEARRRGAASLSGEAYRTAAQLLARSG